LNSTMDDGRSALMFACFKGRLELVRELCNRGADVNAAMADGGKTALMFACNSGHLDAIRELCDRGADVNAVFNGDITVLIGASINGKVDLIRLLLQKGADKSTANVYGETAFDAACGPNRAALRALLKP